MTSRSWIQIPRLTERTGPSTLSLSPLWFCLPHIMQINKCKTLWVSNEIYTNFHNPTKTLAVWCLFCISSHEKPITFSANLKNHANFSIKPISPLTSFLTIQPTFSNFTTQGCSAFNTKTVCQEKGAGCVGLGALPICLWNLDFLMKVKG